MGLAFTHYLASFFLLLLGGYMRAGLVHIWGSEDSLWESVLSFHHVVLGTELRLPGLSPTHLCWVSLNLDITNGTDPFSVSPILGLLTFMPSYPGVFTGC